MFVYVYVCPAVCVCMYACIYERGMRNWAERKFQGEVVRPGISSSEEMLSVLGQTTAQPPTIGPEPVFSGALELSQYSRWAAVRAIPRNP